MPSWIFSFGLCTWAPGQSISRSAAVLKGVGGSTKPLEVLGVMGPHHCIFLGFFPVSGGWSLVMLLHQYLKELKMNTQAPRVPRDQIRSSDSAPVLRTQVSLLIHGLVDT